MCILPSVAAAAVIDAPIIGGVADVTHQSGDDFASFSFSLNGPGVSFTGQGIMTPGPCVLSLCTPGGMASVAPRNIGSISSDDRSFGGTVTLGSDSFDYFALVDFEPSAHLDFSYSLQIPNVGGTPPATLMVSGPFTASAFFFSTAQPDLTLSMEGRGTVTLNLQWLPDSPFGPGYELRSAHYAFLVPEPGTISMVLMAMAGQCLIGIRRRARRGAWLRPPAA
jgi:hypothetical protein